MSNSLPPLPPLQVTTLYAEFLPSAVRGHAVMSLSFFWAAGACFEALLAWAVMPTLGWRYLLGLSTLPLLVFVVLAPRRLPESPLFLAASGRTEEAAAQLRKVAEGNGVIMPRGELVPTDAGAASESRCAGSKTQKLGQS